MSKLKTNEVVLISPNGLVEKTISLDDAGLVKVDGENIITGNSPVLTTPNIAGGLNLDSVGILFREYNGSAMVNNLSWAKLFQLPIGLTFIQLSLGGSYKSTALCIRRDTEDLGTIISKSVGGTYRTDIQLSGGNVQGYQSLGGNYTVDYKYLVIG